MKNYSLSLIPRGFNSAQFEGSTPLYKSYRLITRATLTNLAFMRPALYFPDCKYLHYL